MDFTTKKFSKFIVDCINKMGEIINDDSLNHTSVMYNTVKAKSGVPTAPWYHVYSWNENEEYLFKQWFISEYCKRFRQNKVKGINSGASVFKDFNSEYGLRRNDLFLEEEE